MLTADQLIAAQKSQVETLFGLTQKAFEGVEKLVELQLQATKTALGEAAEAATQALSAKDPQELLSLHVGLLQPAAEKAAAYSRHVYDIAASTQAEVSRLTEAKLSELQGSFMSTVDTLLKNAPAGTENATSLVKSALAAANNAYDSVNKAAKQAAEVAEANLQALTSTAVKAGQAAAAVAPKAPRRAATL